MKVVQCHGRDLAVLYSVCCLKSAHGSSIVAWFSLLGQANMETSAEAGGFIQTPTCLLKKKNIPVAACSCCLATRWDLREEKRHRCVCIFTAERESKHSLLPLPPPACEQLTLSTTAMPCNGAQNYTPQVLFC